MDPWKRGLYEACVTPGHVAHRNNAEVRLADFPYLHRLVLHHGPETCDARICDLGCGGGELLWCLSELGFADAVGVDKSREQVERARRLGLENVVQTDIESFLHDKTGAFDVIFLMDVLEHYSLGQGLALLERIREALRPGGRLVAHVPNAGSVFGPAVHASDLTHETQFAPRSIEQALRASGFSKVSVIEEPPVVHGPLSLARRIVWAGFATVLRAYWLCETGELPRCISRNMLVVASVGESKN